MHNISAYGLSKPKQTTIRKIKSSTGKYFFEYQIPNLNITGTKILKWMSFVQKFRPIKFSIPPKLDKEFPVDELVSKLTSRTEIPIFLPSNIDFSRRDLAISANADGYSIGIYAAPPSSGIGSRSTASYYGAISVYRIRTSFKSGNKRIEDEDSTSTLRNIQLDNGIAATYSSICGAYCMAQVEWKYQGFQYIVSQKGGRQRELVQIANSMISAGSRQDSQGKY